MRLISILLMGLCLSLTACSSFENMKRDRIFSDAKKGRDVCGMKHLQPFIGTAFDNLTVREHLPEKFSFRVFDPRPYLAGGPDQIVTTDLRPRRQNISLDAEGIIISLKCG